MGEGGKMTDYVDKIWLGDRLWVGGMVGSGKAHGGQ
jgi:hypothetical protein